MNIDRFQSLSQDHDLGRLLMARCDLLADDLDQHPLSPPPVKLPVEYALPRAKVEPAVGHRNHHLAAHNLPLQVRVCVVLTRPVVPIMVNGRVRRQPFKPHFVIVVQATLIVVDEYRCGNVLRIYKGQSPLYHIPLSCP